MRQAALLAVILIGQVVAICGLYGWRMSYNYAPSIPWLADSDFFVLALPTVLAAAAAFILLVRTRSVLIAIFGGLGLAFVGFAMSMLVALNTWGS
jgi:hypothetical protein